MTDNNDARILALEQTVQELAQVVYLLMNRPVSRPSLNDGPSDGSNQTRWIDLAKSAYDASKVGTGSTDTTSVAESKALMLFARYVATGPSTVAAAASMSRIPILFPDGVVADLFLRRVYLTDHDPSGNKYRCAALPILGY